MGKGDIRALVRSAGMRAGSKGLPHILEIVEQIINEWGGSKRFARAFFDEFQTAKRGSITRARMLDSILRLLQLTASGSRTDDLGLLSDSDLETMAAELVTKIGAAAGEGKDGTEEPTTNESG